MKVVKDKRVRYLIAGVWNTVFGYFVGIFCYYMLFDKIGIVAVGLASNVVSISMSFATNKLFVFRSQENWIAEYFRSYVVYGFMALIGIFLLWIFVEILNINIWKSQALSIIICAIISYIGHNKYTFSTK